jgi:hypothetical protein
MLIAGRYFIRAKNGLLHGVSPESLDRQVETALPTKVQRGGRRIVAWNSVKGYYSGSMMSVGSQANNVVHELLEKCKL